MFSKIFLLFVGLVWGSLASSTIRLPAVAGQFYPTSSVALKKDIDQYLRAVQSEHLPPHPKILGMIVPHAGYKYSGKTAAYAYHSIKNHSFDVIILLGPYHSDQFPGVSIWTEGTWQTPLGQSIVDEQLAVSLQKESPLFAYDRQIHTAEHSLEVQIPFLQVVAPEVKIVPILISDVRYAKSLAAALYKHLKGRSALVIASTDLSHYHPDSVAREIDQRTQNAFQTLSPDGFLQAYKKGDIELCGAAAVLTLLELSHLMGQIKFINLHYANSSEQTHDITNVVGYNASLVTGLDYVSFDQGQILLKFAKDSLRAYLSNKALPTLAIEDPLLNQQRAVFVTLRDKRGELRGCIGRLEAEEPLCQAVQHMAIEAATKDSRFSPVTLHELPRLSVEISILGMPIDVKSAADIIYGTHGVIVSQGDRSGIFLPEVSKEFASKEEFLSELCLQKAHLPRNCWQSPQTHLKVFSTQLVEDVK